MNFQATNRFDHYSDCFKIYWPWPHFTPKEMSDFETGELIVVPEFMDWLELVRKDFGYPMIINDATRSAKRQFTHSGKLTGSHVDGLAVDVRVYGVRAHALQRAAHKNGVLGIGVYLNPDTPIEKRFIHLDMWQPDPTVGDRPMSWSR